LNDRRFDHVIRSLTGSRRSFLSGVLAIAGGWRGVSEGDARKKRKRKPKKPKPNQYGCLEVGDACKNANQCCSGICEGMKCRAHDTGTCTQQGPEICSIDPPIALTCNNNASCRCFGTTAGSIVCSAFLPENCADCRKDADCVALGFPPGSACAPFSVGPCAGQCETGTTCLLPCGDPFPDETAE
jgi:hypothetical protein